MRAGTSFVLTDEPCYYFEEKNHNGRRIQRITVVRDDQLADYVKDLGPTRSFLAPEVQSIGGQWEDGRLHIWETVGTMMEMFDQFRNRDLSIVRGRIPRVEYRIFGNRPDGKRRNRYGRNSWLRASPCGSFPSRRTVR